MSKTTVDYNMLPGAPPLQIDVHKSQDHWVPPSDERKSSQDKVSENLTTPKKPRRPSEERVDTSVLLGSPSPCKSEQKPMRMPQAFSI